ncbi:putative Bax inhibitor 1 [Blattella germanica]|nr:putative Bax inhibitor 1 [Blattella germanica]
MLFDVLSGMSMGPLLETVVDIDPSIIMTALIGTLVVFTSFSLSAMFAERGRYLYLGGTLMTLLSSMLVLSLANIFFGSYLIFQAHLYLGLLLMCGFILYDTQLIIEKRRNGDKDFVTHSVDLFIDLIGVFRRLVIILTQKVCTIGEHFCTMLAYHIYTIYNAI